MSMITFSDINTATWLKLLITKDNKVITLELIRRKWNKDKNQLNFTGFFDILKELV